LPPCTSFSTSYPQREKDRLSLLRSLDTIAVLRGAHGGGCPAAVDRVAVAAEELGLDGAYFRVHHFARQLGSPFPLLAAVGARTKTIEIGTAVVDMRYENPMYMAEDAGAADIIAAGRLQLGISRGSPEQVIDGWRYFGYAPPDGETAADMARRHAEVFLELLKGEGFAEPNPRPMFANPPGLLRLEPYSEGLRDRIWTTTPTCSKASSSTSLRNSAGADRCLMEVSLVRGVSRPPIRW
jgi:alkanesulfonate monooxygenase SsuD/methylene tetrahydromethanopterin reductase-like flavin-dependent oxidoreductase (luciferase family)